MKPLRYCLFLLLFLPFSGFSQGELNDALLLERYSTLRDSTITITPKHHDNIAQFVLERDSICAVIKKYFPAFARDTSADLYVASFKAAVADNPFMKGRIKVVLAGMTMSQTHSANMNNIGSIISSAGGINVTNFADGLAQFMVQRFKEELSTSFFEKLKNDLNDPKYKDLQLLFPQTGRLLNTIDKNIYQYNIYINSLREAFKNDLSNLYVNLNGVLAQPLYQDYFAKHVELKTILDLSSYLINAYAKGDHPGKVLAALNTDQLKFSDAATQTNVRSAVSTLQLLSESVKSPSKDHYWYSPEVLPAIHDTVLLTMYFGLLYQNPATDRITFVNEANAQPVKLKKLLADAAGTAQKLSAYTDYIRRFADRAQEVSDYVTELRTKDKKEIDYNDYYKLFNSSLGLVQYAFDFIDLPYVTDALPETAKTNIRRESARWLFVSRASADLYVNVRTRDYSSAIINTISIIDTVLSTSIAAQLDTLKKEADAAMQDMEQILAGSNTSAKQQKALKSAMEEHIANGDAISLTKLKAKPALSSIPENALKQALTAILLQEAIAQLKAKGKVREAVLKYGSFMAAVANAQSSDDVKAALEATVLPAGSYSVKRETNFNVSVNGFVGPYGGYEYLPALKKTPWAPSAGFTAPVGIAFSWGNINNGQRRETPVLRRRSNGSKIGGQSISVFVSLIDIGAVASFRLGNDSSKVSSEIKLKNIVSPGLYLYWGLPKYPVSIGIGGQIGPQLRRVTASNVDIDENYYLRFGLNVVVDIPFYNIYSRN